MFSFSSSLQEVVEFPPQVRASYTSYNSMSYTASLSRGVCFNMDEVIDLLEAETAHK